jgi:branched-subunit amino acid transport protein
MNLWLLFGAAGLLTFLIRLSFIAAEGRYRAPAWFVAALPFVPIAVAAWQRNTLLTIGSGFLALWLFS